MSTLDDIERRLNARETATGGREWINGRRRTTMLLPIVDLRYLLKVARAAEEALEHRHSHTRMEDILRAALAGEAQSQGVEE